MKRHNGSNCTTAQVYCVVPLTKLPNKGKTHGKRPNCQKNEWEKEKNED